MDSQKSSASGVGGTVFAGKIGDERFSRAPAMSCNAWPCKHGEPGASGGIPAGGFRPDLRRAARSGSCRRSSRHSEEFRV